MADSVDQQVIIDIQAKFDNAMSSLNEYSKSFKRTLEGTAETSKKEFSKIEAHGKEAAESLEKSGEKAGEGFGKGLTVAFAAAAAVFLERIRETIETASEYASNIAVLSITTGNSRKELQDFEFAMRGAGLSAEAAQLQLSIMERRIVSTSQKAKDTSSVFFQLGLSAKSMVGKGAIENFEAIANKIYNLKDASQKTTVAMELFGRTGAKMLSLINQGPEGIKKAMEEAGGKGAEMSSELLETLEKYDGVAKQFQQSLQAVFATLAGPIIPVLTKFLNGLMGVFNYIEKLSEQTKLTILFTSLLVSFLAFEKGLEVVGSFFAKNLISREAIEFLEAFSGVIGFVIVATGLLYGAVVTNFGGIRDVFVSLAGPVQQFFQGLRDAITVMVAGFNTYIIPAFQKLSDTMRPIYAEVGAQLQSFFANFDFTPFYTAILDIGKSIGDLIGTFGDMFAGAETFGLGLTGLRGKVEFVSNALVQLVNGLRDILKFLADNKIAVEALAAAYLGFAGAQGVMAAVAALNILRVAIIASATWQGIASAVRVCALAFSLDFVGGVRTATASLMSFVTAETLATLGLSLIIGAIVLAIFNWRELSKTIIHLVDDSIAYLLVQLSEIVDAIKNVVDGIRTFVDALSYLNPLLRTQANLVDDLANKYDKYATSIRNAAQAARDKAEGDPDALSAINKYFSEKNNPKKEKIEPPKKEQPHVGGGELNTPVGKGKSATDGTSFGIKELETSLYPLQEAIKQTEAQYAHLGKELKALGTINTPIKLAEAEKIHGNELVNTRKLGVEYNAEIRKTEEIEKRLEQLRRGVSGKNAARDAEQYTQAIHRMTDSLIALHAKDDDLKLRSLEIKKQELAERLATQQALASDPMADQGARLTAETAILSIKRQQGATNAELAKQELTILQTAQLRAKISRDVAIEELDRANAKLKNDTALRNTKGISGPDPTGAQKQALAVDDAQSALAESTNTVSIRQKELASATEALKNSLKTGNLEERAKLTTAESKAYDSLATARNDEAIATLKLNQAIETTTPDVLAVRTGLAGMAQSIAGPLAQAFKDIQAGINPLTASFLALFNQSKSFHDIQETFKQITERLAQVFDAFRPVIDFLLGIVMGLVNVFLEFYNIIVTVLNLFGLHIEKIKLLNSNLGALNKTVVPMLQITHDLPTINEYNKGKSADLVAKNSATVDPMMKGFNATSSKLGEVVGVLLGIKVLVGLLAGKSIASQASSMFGGIFGKLFGKTNGQPDMQNASFGDYGSSGAGVADTANGSFGSYDDPNVKAVADKTSDNTVSTDSNTDVVKIGNEASHTLNSSTNTLSNRIAQLAQYIPLLANIIGGKSGGSGSLIGSLVGLGATIFGNKGKAGGLFGTGDGAANTAGFIAAGESLLAGLMKGGTFSQTLGGVGGAIGTALGGPVGGAIGQTLGSIIGGFFGPKVTPYNQPDNLDTTHYGQGVADLIGHAGANGHEFDILPEMKQAFGGDTGLAAIEKELSKGMAQFMKDTGLSTADYQNDLKMFGASAGGSGTLKFGKNIGDQHVEGADGAGGVYRYNILDDALNSFAISLSKAGKAADAAGSNLAAMLAGATDVNIATMFGNTSVVPGGYAVGGTQNFDPTRNMNTSNVSNGTASTFHITVGNIYGTDTESLKSVFRPVMNDLMSENARNVQIANRTQGYAFGNGNN